MKPEQLKHVHEGGLCILEEVGVVFKDPETVSLFAGHGFAVDGERVFMTADQVHAAIATAPRSFALEARAPHRDLVFGDGEPVISNVAGAAFLIEGGELRAGTMEDQEKCVRLCHMAPNLDLLGQTLWPSDIADAGRYERTVFNYFTLSDKQFEHPISDARQLRAGLDMTEIVYGSGWHEHPRMFAVVNPMSPLVFDVHTCVTTRELARRSQPLCVTPCAMGGTTAPATLAGILVQQHAETLAGIVLIQLVQPGSPAMYGGFSSIASMRTGELLFGVPEFWTLMAATVELAHDLGLPCRAGAGATDGHALDLQAGIETAMGLATVIERDVDYILQATGCLSSINAMSWEKLIVDDELVGILRSRPWDLMFAEDDKALDVIAAVGPGGGFLGQRHTRTHCRDYERPSLFNRQNYGAWAEAGRLSIDAVATRRVAELLEAYTEPDMDTLSRRQLLAYCER